MSTSYITPDELAAKFGRGRQWALRRCASGEFPHLRIGNVIRFKDEHVAEIEAKFNVAAEDSPADTWGRVTRAGRS